MSSISNEEFSKNQKRIADENLEKFEVFIKIADSLDNNDTMVYNINESQRMYNELTSYNYNGFNDSYDSQYFKDNLESMKKIVRAEGRGKEEVISYYNQARSCKNIFNRYRGADGDK